MLNNLVNFVPGIAYVAPPPVNWMKPPQQQQTLGINLKQPISSKGFFPAQIPDLSSAKLRTDYLLDHRSWEYPSTSRPLLNLNLLGNSFHSSFLNARTSQAICKIERTVIYRMVGDTNSKQGVKKPFTVESLSKEEWEHLLARLSASAKPSKTKTMTKNYVDGGYTTTYVEWTEAMGLPELNSGPYWYIKKYVRDFEDVQIVYRGIIRKFQLIYNEFCGIVNCKFTWSCKQYNDRLNEWRC